MKKKVAEIKNVLYGVGNISCEPTNDEIRKAIQEKDFERRSFQGDILELDAEWKKRAEVENEYYYWQRRFHVKKVACLVSEGWEDPILLYKDEFTILDGSHRLKAAIYLGHEEVEVIVTDAPPDLSDIQKNQLWVAIREHGELDKALTIAGIQIIKI